MLLVAGPVGIAAAGRQRGHELVYGLCLVASLLIGLDAAVWLLRPDSAEATAILPFGLPWLEAHFRLDALAAYFLLLVNLLAAVVAVYALGYGGHEKEPGRVLPAYPLFIAGMNLVLLSDDAFSFLLAWEFMSLTSWLLVMASHREPATAEAGYVYLVMAAIGGMALLLAFGVLAGVAGDYSFDAIRAAGRSQAATAAAILLVLLGAGSKAGLVPFHAWLPLAHPAAPSHVSALMSGAMTKVALYAILRVLFDLTVGPTGKEAGWWPGLILIALGSASTFMGALYALWQGDLKKLLAYSTVENVGIVALGLGLSLVFRATGLGGLAGLALAAALLHALNHALLKGLLFCGAGAVITATGERDLERLGGLIHRLPATATCFLIGAAGLSALPPLNGFVSEWLTFQAILGGTKLPPWELKFAVVVAGAVLALAAALAAAVFVRAFGIAFLGRPRSPAAATAREVAQPMRVALYILTGLCVLLGALPLAAIHLIEPVSLRLLGAPLALGAGSTSALACVPFSAGISSYGGVVLLAALAGLALVVILGIHNLAGRRTRRGPAWDCGFPNADPATQYSASSFAQPLRRVFATSLFRARERVEMPAPGDLEPARLEVTLRDLAWEWLYLPVAAAVEWIATRINVLQFLTIRRYLSLMFMALAVLLIVVAVSE